MTLVKEAIIAAMSPEWAHLRDPILDGGSMLNVTYDATTAVNTIAHPHGGSARWIHCDMSGVTAGQAIVGCLDGRSVGAFPTGFTRRGFLWRCLSVLENTPSARTLLWHVADFKLYRNTDDTCRLTWDLRGTPVTFDSTELLPVDEAFDLRVWWIDKDAAGNAITPYQVVVEVIETIGASQTKRTILNERVDAQPSWHNDDIWKWRIGEDADRGCDYYAAGFWGAWEEAGDPTKIMRGVWAVPNAVSATHDAWTLGAGADKVVAIDDTPGETETTDYIHTTVTNGGTNNVKQAWQLPNSLIGASDTMRLLTIYQRWRQSAGDKSGAGAIPAIFDGTNFVISNLPGNTLWADVGWHDQYNDLGVPRPFDTGANGSAWSPTQLDNTELALQATAAPVGSSTGTVQATMLRACVAYELSTDPAVDPPDEIAVSAGRSQAWIM